MDSKLRQLQLTQLDILKEIDSVCRSNNIKYSLYAGTMLGAVRHQGFIPWDDDLDVCMQRADYERFINLWDNSDYILQNKENCPTFTQSFTKIRKNHTTFLQADWERGRYHTGIFVDVFPVDRLPYPGWKRKQYYLYCMLYQLYTREFVPQANGNLLKCGSAIILAITPKKLRPALRRNLLKKLTSYNTDGSCETVAMETVGSMRQTFSPRLCDEYTELLFEGSHFMCFADWDAHLHIKYGDYMQLPPENDRVWKHHPIIIDFEHNYEELKQP